MGRIKGSGEGAGREKRKQAAFWHEVKVVWVLVLRANLVLMTSVEIALTFSLRNTREIPSRTNSKRLTET